MSKLSKETRVQKALGTLPTFFVTFWTDYQYRKEDYRTILKQTYVSAVNAWDAVFVAFYSTDTTKVAQAHLRRRLRRNDHSLRVIIRVEDHDIPEIRTSADLFLDRRGHLIGARSEHAFKCIWDKIDPEDRQKFGRPVFAEKFINVK